MTEVRNKGKSGDCGAEIFRASFPKATKLLRRRTSKDVQGCHVVPCDANKEQRETLGISKRTETGLTLLSSTALLGLCTFMFAFYIFCSSGSGHPNTNAAMLYTTHDSILVWSPSDEFNLTCSQGLVMEVTYHIKSGHIYYTAMSQSVTRLYRINEKILECPEEPLREFPGGSSRFSMAYDWIAGRLYFAHYLQNTLEVCRRGASEGSCFELIRSTPKTEINGPDHLVVHSFEGLLFWVNTGQGNMSIGRSKMDGTDVRSFYKPIVLGHRLKYITGLAAGISHPKLYYSAVDVQGNSVIFSTNYDMESPTIILSRIGRISGLSLLDDSIYWLEDNQIRTTCGHEACAVPEGKEINSFVIYDSRQQPQSRQNHCAEDECSDLCVLSGKKSFTCLCPPMQKLGLDNKTCDWEEDEV